MQCHHASQVLSCIHVSGQFFLSENAPGYLPKELLMVTGDGFFTLVNIEEQGVPRARNCKIGTTFSPTE